MIPYSFHPEAEAELADAAVFYESRTQSLFSSSRLPIKAGGPGPLSSEWWGRHEHLRDTVEAKVPPRRARASAFAADESLAGRSRWRYCWAY